MRTRRFVLGTIVLIGLALAAAASGRGRTTETIFRAFNPNGTPTIHVRSKSGYCYTGSLAINRHDAWRCFVGNFIYDPCFSSSAAPREVVCPDLDVTSGIEIRLTRVLPTRYADPGKPSLHNQPWNIQLTDGQHYQFASGASSVVDKARLNYFCGTSCKQGLWGYPRRRTQPWTILIAPFTAKSLHTRQAIRHVWM